MLLSSPFRRLSVEEGPVDPPVELVNVHGVKTVLELDLLRLKPSDGLVVKLLLSVGNISTRRRLPGDRGPLT